VTIIIADVAFFAGQRVDWLTPSAAGNISRTHAAVALHPGSGYGDVALLSGALTFPAEYHTLQKQRRRLKVRMKRSPRL
jgi:hypothetical protein